MTRDHTKKMKNTYGHCEVCNRFYPDGEYVLKYDKILCKKHMNEYEENKPKNKYYR